MRQDTQDDYTAIEPEVWNVLFANPFCNSKVSHVAIMTAYELVINSRHALAEANKHGVAWIENPGMA